MCERRGRGPRLRAGRQFHRTGRASMGAHRDRPEEDFARKVIEQTLGLPVQLHDTGKAASAWDFTIDPDGDPQAVEVVRFVDSESIKNAVAARKYMSEGVRLQGLRRIY